MPPIQSIAQSVVASGLPCLVVDSCSLLDVAAGHARITRAISMEGALDVLQAATANPPGCMVVRASLVEREFRNNIDAVQEQARSELEKLRRGIAVTDAYCKAAGLNSIDREPDHTLADSLAQTAEVFLDTALPIEDGDDFRRRADTRVQQHIAPSKKGKDSYKDCVIFEEALELARLITAEGGGNPVIFLTSNTTDYKEGNAPRHEIRNDADAAGLAVCFTWQEARFRLLGPKLDAPD